MAVSRRGFLKASAATTIFGTVGSSLLALAKEVNLPLGIQLWSVRTLLPKDYDGTLQMVSGIGYREVEAAGFYGHKASDVKLAMTAAKLNCVSSHHGYADLHTGLDELIEFHKILGTQSIVCSSPGRRPEAAPSETLTLDDWRWMADQLNSFGDKVNSAGLRFGYHNHFHELIKIDGIVPYDELMKRTDPARVTMEMDCGWVVAGGGSPREYLKEYPTRITMLHVKDFVRPTAAQTDPGKYNATELGRGYIDYKPILEEAKKTGNVKHIFVEQEEYDIPVTESLTVDAEYMRRVQGLLS